MTNVLLLSSDDLFADDLQEQIKLQNKDFVVLRSLDTGNAVDIIVVDENLSPLQNYSNLQVPIFWLTSSHSKEVDGSYHVFQKPIRLNLFLNTLFSAISRFENSAGGYLFFNDYELHPMNKEIINLRNGELIKLTEKEVAIIKYLYKAGQNIVSKNDLLQEVWGYSPDVSTHTIETHIYRLRQKVEHDDKSAQLILTSEGGYQLNM